MTDRPLWRSAEPKRAYDVVIVGGGGHGLSTAYHLARYHGITDVCVLEKGWLAGGNVARNTTIVRSNYLWDESAAIYERSLQMWEGLEGELGFDVEFRQRGVLALAHHEGDERASARRIHANRLQGIDAEWLSAEEVGAFCPIVNLSPDIRYPVVGGALQRRGGTARHDKVAWAFATRASELGVDIVEHAEVTGFDVRDGRIERVRTTRGEISARRVALVAAGHTSVLAAKLGLRLPLRSHPLQALVSVLLEPVLEPVVLSSSVHVYVSQADKGELVMGAGMDPYPGYAQRGSFRIIEYQIAAAVELFPIFANAKLLRTWAGIVDVAPDASPIISRMPIENLFLNCGWGTGGFKATPVAGMAFAELIATGEPGPLAAPFGLERFTTGALVDEHGAAAVAH